MTGRLHVVSKAEKQFLDDAVFSAERAKGKKLSWPEKKRCCVLPASSFWDSLKPRLLNRHVQKNGRPLNSSGASPSLFVVNL
jgi:hypothetical protein